MGNVRPCYPHHEREIYSILVKYFRSNLDQYITYFSVGIHDTGRYRVYQLNPFALTSFWALWKFLSIYFVERQAPVKSKSYYLSIWQYLLSNYSTNVCRFNALPRQLINFGPKIYLTGTNKPIWHERFESFSCLL